MTPVNGLQIIPDFLLKDSPWFGNEHPMSIDKNQPVKGQSQGITGFYKFKVVNGVARFNVPDDISIPAGELPGVAGAVF